jgi:putative (di)nucleoside polyphosphate hydrolase
MAKHDKLDFAQKPYRRGVGIVLFNDKKQVFIAQRIDNPGPAWQMPQGGIDKDEKPIDAAWRELQEETGVTSAKLIEESKDWLRYDLPEELADQLWKGRYRGQEQKWFAFRFTGQESEIKIDGPHPEFSTWKWAPFADTPKLIVPFKRKLYDLVFEEFRHLVD